MAIVNEIATPSRTNIAVVDQEAKTESPSAVAKDATSDKKAIADLLNELATVHQQQGRKIIALNQRFEKVNLGAVLTPDNLTNRESINKSRSILKQFAELIGERDSMYASFAKEGEAILQASSIKPEAKIIALKVFHRNWTREKKYLDSLSAAQLNIVDSSSMVLNLADANFGSLVAKDGNILFRTQEQLDAYQLQLRRINEYAQDEQRASAGFQQATQEIQGNANKDLKAMQK